MYFYHSYELFILFSPSLLHHPSPVSSFPDPFLSPESSSSHCSESRCKASVLAMSFPSTALAMLYPRPTNPKGEESFSSCNVHWAEAVDVGSAGKSAASHSEQGVV